MGDAAQVAANVAAKKVRTLAAKLAAKEVAAKSLAANAQTLAAILAASGTHYHSAGGEPEPATAPPPRTAFGTPGRGPRKVRRP